MTGVLRNRHSGHRKIVLVGDDVPVHVNEKGIVIMNVIDFMKDPGSLKSIRSASKV